MKLLTKCENNIKMWKKCENEKKLNTWICERLKRVIIVSRCEHVTNVTKIV